MLSKELSRLKKSGEKIVDGEFIFKLYDTYGFPVDIVRDLAIEKGLTVDEPGFNKAMEVQRQQSKSSWKGAGLAELGEGAKVLLEQGLRTEFLGYDTLASESEIVGLIDEHGKMTDKAETGARISIVCPQTPFYAESGGQCGDRGEIKTESGKAEVLDTVLIGEGLVLHQAEVKEGAISSGDKADLFVDGERRQRTANNHTATHLLQAALKSVLGDHVKQSGSLVDPERLRFDFTNFSPLSPDEIGLVEDYVNQEIRRNSAVETTVLDREAAIKDGATALFGEKYEDEVRVVAIEDTSKELCGGTHVGATGEIGLVKIVTESGIAAGVRRIEAISGPEAMARFQQDEKQLAVIAEQLKATPEDIQDRITRLQKRLKELEKELSQVSSQQSVSDLDGIVGEAQQVGEVKVISSTVKVDSPKTLREVGDKLRDKMGSGIAVLGAAFEDKVGLLAIVSKDLAKTYHAGNLIKDIAAVVGGSGGGRPDMAQAGGTMPDKLDEALARVYDVVEKQGK